MTNMIAAAVRPAVFVLLLISSFFSFSCSSSSAASVEPASRPVPVSAKKMLIPEGWVLRPGANHASDLRIMRNDSSASMTIRELRPLATAKSDLDKESISVLGNISMQNKLGKIGDECRILRTPIVIGDTKPLCVYIYSENSLLRRVVVFRSRAAIYEVELLQNVGTLPLSSFVDAQTAVVKAMTSGD